mmetsp:Transcript_29573/g.76688  ORF Transcript_29573/g.76688 Transcript_29573/m.76688 type:complete len:211 (-) Transcript_29573:116-748(-)|eukprot:CAMPEP_0202398366 /NCGR_PEP_ID=MMETSP1128-20130828/1256_1 /ASSEMBLY_ACC=CAM_ASM_000463 /TAXON_ID=3047 /ORGANISM="Dunaliella tertiolecta, Strain CCMP1320" /LENGTH=210 /DNA_ID=CAMNT_0049001481 /DNA_START=1 /DNA_END=633 /DNA_ORIENTATION=-
MLLQTSKVCTSGSKASRALTLQTLPSPCCCFARPVCRTEFPATVSQSLAQAVQPGQVKLGSPGSREQPCQPLNSPVSTNPHPAQHTTALATVLALASLCAALPADAAAVMNAEQAHQLQDILRPTFALFTALYIVRIPMTWYPSIDGRSFPWTLAYTPTEPLLAPTRKLVGLVGGVDISPIIWVALLSFFNEILLGPQGLLVLVERQGGL